MKNSGQRVYSGRCLCGSVRYEVEGEPRIVAHCHCEECQRLTGTGHSTGAMFPIDNFSMTGEVCEYKYQSANGNRVTKVFCPSCGSPIFGCNTGMEGFLTISLGTLDNSSEFKPTVVVFARNRKPWDVMDQSIQTFDTQPSWTPEDGA